MATQLTIPFGGTDAVSLSTSGSSLFSAGSQIQADPVNNALRSSSLISSVLAGTLFTAGLDAKTTNNSKADIAATFKHFDIHMVTLSIDFSISTYFGCYVCAVIPTINHQNAFTTTSDIKAYFDNTTHTFSASGFFIKHEGMLNMYAASLQITSNILTVVGIRTDQNPPRVGAEEISQAAVSDFVIPIY